MHPSDLSALIAESTVCAGLSLLLYIYILYPLLLHLAAARRLKQAGPCGRLSDRTPVSVIICARNEASVIEGTVTACLQFSRQRPGVEIIVVSDASTDETDRILAGLAGPGVRLLRTTEHAGKRRGQDLAVQASRGEVLVFLDANTRCAPADMERLLGAFTDPTVGSATGKLRYLLEGGGGHGESLYEVYEDYLRQRESVLGGLLHVHGGFCAVRRSLYLHDADRGAAPDFVEPLSVIRRGWRVLYVPEAVAWEPAEACMRDDAARKRRIVRRGIQTICCENWCLNPFRHPLYAWQMLSHKVLRWGTGLLLLSVLAASLVLWADGHSPWLVGTQGLFYSLAMCGWACERRGTHLALFHFPYYFVSVNTMALLGLTEWLVLGRKATWEPRRRAALRPPASAPGNRWRPPEAVAALRLEEDANLPELHAAPGDQLPHDRSAC